MGHADHSPYFEMMMDQVDWDLVHQEADDELLAYEYAVQVEADYQAGRQLFLDNLPLGWCENADQREGWLGMLPPEERQQAIRDALAAEPLVVDAADELPF